MGTSDTVRVVHRSRRTPCYIFEGRWWRTRETPLVLPHFQALALSFPSVDLSHCTFRSADDLTYWVGRIGRGERAFVYVASHGHPGGLCPVDRRSTIGFEHIHNALRAAKDGAIEFLHFGSCELIDLKRRRRQLEELAESAGARWVSGYTKMIDWVPALLLDLALVAELYVPFRQDMTARRPNLRSRAQWFFENYEQLARALGFSGLSRHAPGPNYLFSPRLGH